MLIIAGLLIFLCVLVISVVIHEGGHMLAAKSVGLQVPRFFAGFGRTLWSFHRGGTEYGVKAIPLGGFVEIHDNTREDEREKAMLSYVHPLKRIWVFVAGPAVNIVAGFIICVIALSSITVPMRTNIVGTVNDCVSEQACGSMQAGIKAGDKILSIDGVAIDSVGKNIRANLEGKEVANITVNRDGKELAFQVPITDNLMGIHVKSVERQLTLTEATVATKNIVVMSVNAVLNIHNQVPAIAQKLIGRDNKATQEAPASIVGVGKAYSDIVNMSDTDAKEATGFKHISPWSIRIYILVMYTAMLNLGLGLINLLPLLPLDGGRIAIALFDWLKSGVSRLAKRKYKPLSYKAVARLTVATGVIVIGFSLFVITADIVSLVLHP